MIELEEHAEDKLVIFAGYGGTDIDEKNNKMKEFIDANPGIKSRINSTFYFPSYTAPEMAEIFKKHAEISGYELPENWKEPITAYFSTRVNDEDIEGAIRRAREENKQISGRVKVHNRIGF